MDKLIINKLLKRSNFKTENDFKFFCRVYEDGDLSKYSNRLQNIAFCNLNNVFDHGCGFGQWSFALSELNKNILSYDIDESRIKTANRIKKFNKNRNITFTSQINYNDSDLINKFDGIFSYGVIQGLDYKKMLLNYYKLLMPGGKLYFTAIDLGWLLHCVIEGHNDTVDYSSRDWGIDSINNSLNYFINGEYKQGATIFIPYNQIKNQLEEVGFKVIGIGGDGSINLSENGKNESFFPFEKYNLKAVYEVLCEKI